MHVWLLWDRCVQGWHVYHLDHVGLPFVSLSISHVHESMTCPMRAWFRALYVLFPARRWGNYEQLRGGILT